MLIRSLTVGFVALSLAACGGSEGNGAEGSGGRSSGEGDSSSSGGGTSKGGSSGGAGGASDDDGGVVGAGGGGSVLTATPQEITLKMDGFQVPPGGEFYKCQDFPNTFGGNIAIVESKSEMTPGSHHMFVFRLASSGFYGGMANLGPGNTEGPLVDCPSGGTEFHPFVHAAQTPEQDFTYPDGLGQAFNSDETVRLMVHYLNTTSDAIDAAVTVTLKYVDAKAVTNLAASVFLNSLSITVPPGTSTQGFSYTLPMDINLLGAAGHMHRRGTHFVGSAVFPDGTNKQLYTTDTWDEPVPAVFSPAVAIPGGSTINWACTYSNSTGQTLRFGESASTNEMCIFTGTYYPAPGGGGIYDQDFSPAASQ